MASDNDNITQLKPSNIPDEEPTMLKQTILALASLTTLSIAIVPATTGSALAQRCTANYCPDNNPDGGDTYECTDQLGHLRRVYEDELEEITNPNHVSIMPVCIGEDY